MKYGTNLFIGYSIIMNEKFFDLKKDKQDRMINAGLRIFALNGYHHASTDEIVQTAQVSKGLLFHYFGSKAEFYGFLYNYTSRFVILGLKSSIRNNDIDFFDLQSQILDVETDLMATYPFTFLFFESVKLEEEPEAIASLEELDVTVPDAYGELEEKSRWQQYTRIDSIEHVSEIIHYIKMGLMRELLDDPSTPLSLYRNHAQEYLNTLQSLCRP